MPQRSAVVLLHVLLVSLVGSTSRVVARERIPPPLPAQSSTTSRPVDVVPSPASAQEKIVLPVGTHLPLVLHSGINTRTAKAGDSVYFETVYPIAQNNRIVIPMGTFVRGQLLESRRPGFVKGRGAFRMVLDQLTFPNGYTISLTATPNSADTDGKTGVDAEGTIKGPANIKRDVGTILGTTAGGAYIGTLVGAINSGAPGKGSAIGGGAGLLAGLAVVLLTRGPEAELPRGTTIDVIFDRPLVLDASYLPPNNAGEYSPPRINGTTEPDTRRKSRTLHRPLLPPLFPFLRF